MTDIEFLEAKLEAYASAAGPEYGDVLRKMFSPALEEMRSGDSSRLRAEGLERDLESFVSAMGAHTFGDAVQRDVRARFGFGSLGASPAAVIKQVLERGSISSDIEARIVLEYVSNVGNEDELGQSEFHRLASILDQAGY